MPHFKAPDNSLHFLSDVDLTNGGAAMLPVGCSPVSDAEVAAIHAAAQTSAPIPDVTPRQIRLALTQLNLRSQVESAVAAADQNTKDTWEFATTFERSNPLVATLATQLNVTSIQLDDLWKLAATL